MIPLASTSRFKAINSGVVFTFAIALVTAPCFGQPFDDSSEVYPTAILPFQERGEDAEGMGPQVADLLFAGLIAHPDLYLVDRADIEQTIKEQELSLTGLVGPNQQTALGQFTGARLLITGSVIRVNGTLYLVAKVIGTETTRIAGASVKGSSRDDLSELVDTLATEVHRVIQEKASKLVARVRPRGDQIAALKEKIGGGKKPTVYISVEERHVGARPIDPAAETELMLIFRELGFEVIDPIKGVAQQADVLVKGEGFSEFATRTGNLISVKARLEVKAIDRASGKVLAADRQTRIAVDLAEQIAGKTALQEAALDIAERLLPKIVSTSKE